VMISSSSLVSMRRRSRTGLGCRLLRCLRIKPIAKATLWATPNTDAEKLEATLRRRCIDCKKYGYALSMSK
jgi:hypothetical protein